MSSARRAIAIAAILTLAIVPAALADTVYATVTGYAEGTAANNNPATFGADCTKVEDPGGSAYVLTDDAALVIVKAGSEASAPGHVNTRFENASAGETVWADTNGNGAYDPGGKDGDKDISHVILCPAEEAPSEAPSTAPSEEPSTAPSDEPSVEPSAEPSDPGDVDTGGGDPGITPPPTDTLAIATSSTDPGPIIFGLAVLSIIVGAFTLRRRSA